MVVTIPAMISFAKCLKSVFYVLHIADLSASIPNAFCAKDFVIRLSLPHLVSNLVEKTDGAGAVHKTTNALQRPYVLLDGQPMGVAPLGLLEFPSRHVFREPSTQRRCPRDKKAATALLTASPRLSSWVLSLRVRGAPKRARPDAPNPAASSC